mgnify:CR=1 FL=1
MNAACRTKFLPLITAFNGLLKRVDALRGQEARFVADAAHELRSPLTALSLQAEALEKTNLSAEAREKVQTLRSGIDRAVRQVSQLLALKRAQSARLRPMPLRPMLPFRRPLAKPSNPSIGEAERLGITIEVEGLEDLPVNADPSFAMKPDDLFTNSAQSFGERRTLLAQRRHRHGQARADRAAGALRHG